MTVDPRAQGGQPLTLVKARFHFDFRIPSPAVAPSTEHTTDPDNLASRIYDASHLTGTFTLRSGVVSSEYFDKYMFESDPALLHAVASAMLALVPSGMDALVTDSANSISA